MQLNRFLAIATLVIGLHSCNKTPEITIVSPDKIQIHQKLTIALENTTNSEVEYFLDGISVGKQPSLHLDIHDYKLGKHTLQAKVGTSENATMKEKKVIFLAPSAPKVYGYKVIHSFPHDRTSFTQGLEFHNNHLYEGTGQRGKSVLRKVDLHTGEVLQEQALAKKFFGEGITIFNDKIYQLTWQNKLGFIYDLDTFKTLNTFSYQESLEGWGLTHNNTHLIKSDGSEKIWFLNPENGKEERVIEVYTNKKKINNLNELEYIDGKIYANVWTKNAIVIINPKNGAVEALVNMKNLAKQLDNKTVADSQDKVLNGIAYNATTKKLYVTGKNWDKIFEIEIIK